MGRCWTCKKRRLKCDGGVPYCQKCWGHGVECLGYKKPLTWVKGVARRGPMKNRTFGESEQQSLSFSEWNGLSTCQGYYYPAQASILWPASFSMPMTLTEPLFKDLGNIPRFFIDYFSKRVCGSLVFQDHPENPYRKIIPWIRSPMVATAIVTVAACHYIQSLTGSTLPGLPAPGTDQAPPLTTPEFDVARLTTSERTLINYYLRSKELSLNLVSSHLAMHHPRARDEASVIAIVLLAVLDIFESGSGAWNVHLEGSKKLIEAGSINTASVWDSSVEALLSEAATFQILGFSLAKPGALNSESTLPVTQIRTSSTVAPIGCPVAILSAIETFALKRRVNGSGILDIALIPGMLQWFWKPYGRNTI
ncbi:putative c6 finger domain protein acr-2 [Fusarium flagelliforme]|uniref:Putative c6 finger domain protein acr-2 n=1 Tax=Fusarium flagelliforme TaxID=2675880 RepID=A0A395MRS4_9HYPO|nr:putative c6 finger domain protein acr-2 [Fusarium flagelliforme]